MFRIYCLQNWFNFSDRQMEDTLYEIDSMRRSHLKAQGLLVSKGTVVDAIIPEKTISTPSA